jgi:hypothetical protein
VAALMEMRSKSFEGGVTARFSNYYAAGIRRSRTDQPEIIRSDVGKDLIRVIGKGEKNASCRSVLCPDMLKVYLRCVTVIQADNQYVLS